MPWLRTGECAEILFGSRSPAARRRTRRLIATGLLPALPVSVTNPKAGWLIPTEALLVLHHRAAAAARERADPVDGG